VPKLRKVLTHRPLRKPSERANATRAEEKPPAASGIATFAHAAGALGVAVLPSRGGRVRAASTPAAPVIQPASDFVVREEEGWLEGYRSKLGPRVLERLRGAPRATLDLHGLRLVTARERLADFVARAPYPEAAVVRVIVGKGRHSPGGRPVLAGEISSWLRSGSNARRVLAFCSAPRELGGSGSVLVLLAGSSPKP
jgi:DNA-nicking Smr family endonuclease